MARRVPVSFVWLRNGGTLRERFHRLLLLKETPHPVIVTPC